MYRINGELRPVEHPPLTEEDMIAVVDEIITAKKKVELAEQGTCDFAYSILDVSRFRVNVFHQRGMLRVAIRAVKLHPDLRRAEPAGAKP